MNSYIETAISLILIFFVFSIIAYVLQELIAVNLQYRGKVLWESLSHLFDNATIKGRSFLANKTKPNLSPNTAALYDHPQISSLRKNIDRLPAYIPAANFALAIMDIAALKAPDQVQTDQFQKLRSGINIFIQSQGDIGKILKNLVETSTDTGELQQKIEQWYNSYMDRVTGWYKSHTLLTLRLIALCVTLFFNINVIKISKDIYNNAELRGKLVSVAEHVTDHPETVTMYYTKNFDTEIALIDAAYKQTLDTITNEAGKVTLLQEISQKKLAAADTYTKKRVDALDTLTKTLSGAGLPLGWNRAFIDELTPNKGRINFGDYLLLLIGWLIAAGCISMGAPFWFDVLMKVVNLRRTGIKPAANNNVRK